MSDQDRDDSFAAMFEREAPRTQDTRRKNLRVGERLEGVVIKVAKDTIFVELDGKRQAFMDAIELRAPDGTMPVKEGDKLTANIVEIDDTRGIIRLGKTLGRPGNLAQIEQAKQTGVAVEGKVTGVNKGGLDVDLGGARAFCPMSQIDSRRTEDASHLIGQSLRFVVTDVKDGGKNVVVSRRALLEREAAEGASRAMADIATGAVMRGTVTGIRDFGAFVDLGGIEGLIPRSEIAHDRRVSVEDALKPGDQVEVQVREIKEVPGTKPGAPSTRKITLSLKALTADPWTELAIIEGRVSAGTVTKNTEFGVFIRLAPGIEGLLHISELGRGGPPGEGEELRVVVKKIDREAKKISLVPAPEGAEVGSTVKGTSVAVGAVVDGTVERIETYGIFVQLEGTKGRAGRGLVPNAELGVPRGTDLRKTFPEGMKVTAKVLETGDGRLRLSIKGAKDAEERADYEQAKSKGGAPASLGTFADLLKGRKL
jgi:small subunit ribosomal protein S1